jgi:molybdate transport system regulatory protein
MEKSADKKLNGMLWIEIAGDPVIGPGRVELLKNIQACGSIRQAAIQMGMSYRKAWDLIEHMNENLETPVVISSRGGKGGGQATVTEKGSSAIAQFDEFYKKFQKFLDENTPDIKL